jgi:hypothetical protein
LKKNATFSKLILHSSLAVLLTMLTVILGAPLLRLVRQSQGSLRYWATGTLFVLVFAFTGAAPLAVLLASVWVTIGIYSELEQRGRGWWTSGLSALFAGSLMAFVGTRELLRRSGIISWDRFVDLVRDFTGHLQQMNPSMKPDAEILAQQAPSVLVILLLLTLGMGLIFERRLFVWAGLPRERVASHLKLLDFRLPDSLIWIALTAFLVTIVNFGFPALAVLGANIVNVCFVLYFFQGLAVLEVFLNSLKAGLFMRVLAYVLLVGQLFFVLSLVGLIDYWVDFRRRLSGSGMATENS